MTITKKIKYTLLLLVVVALVFPLAQSAFAFEVDYPSIPLPANFPGFGPQTGSTNLLAYIYYFFVFFISIAGLIGLAQIVTAGFKILLQAGNPESINDARDRILNAVLGIILLFSSFIILRTINPELVKLRGCTSTNSQGECTTDFFTDGVYYTNADESEWELAPRSEGNTDNLSNGMSKLFYYCSPDSDLRNVIVWVYNQDNFQIDHNSNGGTTNSIVVKCGDPAISITGSVKSFRWAYEEYGIYYYLKPNCQGISSNVYNSSSNITGIDPNDPRHTTHPIQSMRIVSGIYPGETYGAVLTKSTAQKGECSAPILTTEISSECQPMPIDLEGEPFNPQAMYIVKQDLIPPPENRVDVYSKNLYVRLYQDNAASGGIPINDHYVYDGSQTGVTLNDFISNEGTNFLPPTPPAPDEECTEDDENGPQCLHAITMIGDYRVFLYAQNQGNPPRRECTLFTEDQIGIQNFDIAQNNNTFYRLDIIPVYH